MLRLGGLRQVRFNSTLASSRQKCLDELKKHDKSSYIIQSYVQNEHARDAFIAIRSLCLDLSKLNAGATGSRRAGSDVSEPSQIKLGFWREGIQRVFQRTADKSGALNHPTLALLDSTLDHVDLSKRYFITLIQSREAYMGNRPFPDVDSMAVYGEGLFSQPNYLFLEATVGTSKNTTEFLKLNPEVHSELHTIIAHIGQGSGIAALLKGLPYYINQRNYVPLPVQGLVSHDLSEEEVLRGTFDKDKLSSLIFEVATRANDHLISANTLLEQLKHNLNSVPDAPKGGYFTSSMFLPMMSYIPTKIFLEKLESADFDIFSGKLQTKDNIALPYKSWRASQTKSLPE
ncbi:isoprenoid synthase domain-containing protein [Yarrowia lipolytica]|uniref:YALI0A14388p n=1 Tax=Yarrowia lipolytica (strain CLIB 122 / E 150) TaxID=284591 RepID=Q6CH06_YARLI|nr:YALI0A14388p [Yarrowia lipolytica CLIB122]RDW32223.1 isoprenoid synthase domain-containing protein [Yarrowia lipolytica]CAG83985.1 YALI0A14388p [Yarrowia lipolytica CLIB122]|eukprot:XP_500056.1 YALI0A14388p [Yarrowia lipolytica CLIB122]